MTNGKKIISFVSGKRKTGAIAQLGERLNGIQEVSGSIPLSSTGLRFEKSDRKKTVTTKLGGDRLIVIIIAQTFALAGISGVEKIHINAFLIKIQSKLTTSQILLNLNIILSIITPSDNETTSYK